MDLGTMYATLTMGTKGMQKTKAQLQAFEKRAQRTQARINTLRTNIDAAGASVAKWSGRLQVASERLMRIGYYTSMYLTLPIVGAGAATLAFQKRFGAVMFRVEHLLENNTQKVQDFTNSIVQMGPEVGQGPFALARSLEAVQQEGIKVEDSLNIVEEASKAAAMTGQRNVSMFARAVGNVATGLKVSGEEAAGFVAQLTGRAGMMLQKVTMSVGEVGTQARMAGLSLRELGSMFDVLDDMGRHLYRSTTELKGAFQTLNMSTEPVAKNLRNILKEQGLVPFLEKLNEYAEEKDGVIAEIFPKGSLRVLDDLRSHIDDLRKTQNEWSNSLDYIDDKHKEFKKTVEYQFRSAISTLETTFVKLGNVMKKPMIYFLEIVNEKLKDFTDAVKNLSQEQIEAYLSTVKWIAVIGPLTIGLGLIGSIIGSVGVAVGKLISVIQYLLTPWGILIAVLGTTVTLIGRNIAQNRKHQKELDKTAKLAEKYGVSMEYGFRAGQKATEDMREKHAELEVLRGSLKRTYEQIDKAKGKLQEFEKGSVEYKATASTLSTLEAEREEIIKRLNENYGDYLEKQLDAGMAYSEIAKQLDKANAALEKRIKLKAAEVASEELMEKMIEAQQVIWRVEKELKKLNEERAGMEGYTPLMQSKRETIRQWEELKKVYQEQWREMQKMMDDLDITMGGGDDARSEIDKLEERFQSLYDTGAMSEEGELSPIQKLSNELKELRMQGKFMGDEFDKMDDKIGAYENAITSLIEKIVKGEGDTEKLRRQLNQLSITYENLSKIDESISSLAEVQTGMNNIQKETVETDRLMKNAFRGMQTSLETALEDSKNIFRAFSDFFGDFIQGLIIKMASAIAATLLLTLLLPAPTTAHGVSMGQFG
ncbi:MAG: phage tail tape measure protein, partial [Bacteroidales bacterium]